jgi:hypothetical protein
MRPEATGVRGLTQLVYGALTEQQAFIEFTLNAHLPMRILVYAAHAHTSVCGLKLLADAALRN